MKLLLIVDDYLPQSTKVAAKMMHELAIEFQINGHEVSVLTPIHSQKDSFSVNFIDGIKVLSFKSGKIKNIGKIKRAINETLLSFNAWKSARNYFSNNYYEGIIYYSPSIFWGLLVKKLREIWNCNSYLILRDIFPQWALDNGLIRKNSLILYYFKTFERINYKNAGAIGVMSPSNLQFFKNTLKDISKFEVLYNWSKIPTVQKPSGKFRKELNLENKVVLFYGGNIGHAQNISLLIDLSKQLMDMTNVHLLFVGTGDEVDYLISEKKKFNLSNITYLPPVNQNTYFELLNDFDIGLFSLHPDHKTHNFPGKILGYMSYSKPILGCVNYGNDLKDVINEANAGIIVDSNDISSFFLAAKSLIESESKRINMGKNGKKLLSSLFSVESACLQIVKSLELK